VFALAGVVLSCLRLRVGVLTTVAYWREQVEPVGAQHFQRVHEFLVGSDTIHT